MQVFEGKTLVLPGQEFKEPFALDNNERNGMMIGELSRKDVNGLFLFYLYDNELGKGNGFLMPPGLTKEQMAVFQTEFLNLFEKYAKLANKK